MEKKQTAVQWLIEKIEMQRENGNTDLRTTLHYCDKAYQMEKQQQESEQIELINWLKDSLTTKEFYITYEAEELLEKFKTK